MRSLFWKIFLSFWLLLTSLVLALVLTISAHRRDVHFASRDVTRVAAGAEQAVSEYERGGKTAFSAAIAKTQEEIHGELWVIDEAGQPLQGGELPDRVKGPTTIQVGGGEGIGGQSGQVVSFQAKELPGQGGEAGSTEHPPAGLFIHIPIEHHGHRYTALAQLPLPPGAAWMPHPPPEAMMSTQLVPAPGGPAPAGPPPPEGFQRRVFATTLPPWGGLGLLNDLTLQIPLVILLSSVICFLLARYLTRPILSLRMAAQSIASGDLQARADHRFEGRDELGELSRDFNRMATRLEETLSGQKRMFADVSHELRSPLSRLTLALELAKQRAGPAAASALARIELETERMNHLVTQILRLTKLETGVLNEQSEEVSATDLLNGIAADAEIEAAAKQCSLRVVNQCDATVKANYEALRSAVENVVRNAISYSPQESAVEITQRRITGLRVAIEVLDHGPGIPEADLEKVFQPFHRADDSRTRSTGGVGLGLAIAQRAVAAHGGSIRAVNQAGAGLLVTITLDAIRVEEEETETSGNPAERP